MNDSRGYRTISAWKTLLFGFHIVFSQGIGVEKMNKTITLALLAIWAIGSFSTVLDLASGDVQLDKTWGRMNGIINQWGDDPVFGNIRADAFIGNHNGTVREWARVFAMWNNKTVDLEDPDMVRQPLEPGSIFGVQFYTARLTNSTEILFNLTGYDLYIAGNWTVMNITTTVTTNELGRPASITRTFEPVVTDAHGELKVENTTTVMPKPFELNIDGIDILKGFAFRQMIRHIEVKFFDVDGDGKVDIRDLVKTARRYKAVPGTRGYSVDFDFNGNGMIDIGALTTIAANIEG
jgi:hypothetical protein